VPVNSTLKNMALKSLEKNHPSEELSALTKKYRIFHLQGFFLERRTIPRRIILANNLPGAEFSGEEFSGLAKNN
jgi:hypothetical protein